MHKNKIYLAGPFFSDQQIEHVRIVEQLLKQNPTIDADNIFVPMDQDGEIPFEFGSPEWQRLIFNSDVRQIHQADCIVAILDYVNDETGENQPDSGTVFEIGVAYQADIPIILVQFNKAERLNLMLAQGFTHFFNGSDAVEELSTYDFNRLIGSPVDVSVI